MVGHEWDTVANWLKRLTCNVKITISNLIWDDYFIWTFLHLQLLSAFDLCLVVRSWRSKNASNKNGDNIVA